MRIPSSIPHYPNFSRLLHPSSHNHVQSWFELRCRLWRESGVGVWPDEGDCGSDVFQVSFSYPILKARDWLNGGTLSWGWVVRWKVRLVQWREVWPCEWRWAQHIRGIAKKKNKGDITWCRSFPSGWFIEANHGLFGRSWAQARLTHLHTSNWHSHYPRPISKALFTPSPINFWFLLFSPKPNKLLIHFV